MSVVMPMLEVNYKNESLSARMRYLYDLSDPEAIINLLEEIGVYVEDEYDEPLGDYENNKELAQIFIDRDEADFLQELWEENVDNVIDSQQDSFAVMLNYLHPLNYKHDRNFEDKLTELYNIVGSQVVVVSLEGDPTDCYYLGMCGAGFSMGQHLAVAYALFDNEIPRSIYTPQELKSEWGMGNSAMKQRILEYYLGDENSSDEDKCMLVDLFREKGLPIPDDIISKAPVSPFISKPDSRFFCDNLTENSDYVPKQLYPFISFYDRDFEEFKVDGSYPNDCLKLITENAPNISLIDGRFFLVDMHGEYVEDDSHEDITDELGGWAVARRLFVGFQNECRNQIAYASSLLTNEIPSSLYDYKMLIDDLKSGAISSEPIAQRLVGHYAKFYPVNTLTTHLVNQAYDEFKNNLNLNNNPSM